MKKYYVFDNNGKYISQDGKTRFSLLQGQALRLFFNSDTCKGKRFMKLKPEKPTDDEIYIELKSEHIKAYRVAERHEQYISDTEEEYCPDDVLSLDAPISDSEDDLTLADVIADPEADIEELYNKRTEITLLYRAISYLDDDDQKLIQALFFDGITLDAYGDSIGLTHQAISKRKKAVLEKLKKYF